MTEREKIPGLEPGMKTKGLVAGYLRPWPMPPSPPACADPAFDPEWWHPTREATRIVAERICGGCPLAKVCREVAAARGEYGVWGGVLFDNGVPVEHALALPASIPAA